MMDPIECIAQRMIVDCTQSMDIYVEINGIIDSSETIASALQQIRAKAYEKYVDLDHPELVQYDIGCYRRCIDSMTEIKRMARKVFVVNFFESDAFYVFNQEISFSYACKMLSNVGPKLAHFSNHPTAKEVMQAELGLACNTRFLALDLDESDLLCLESMPVLHKSQANSATTSI
jgi:hypothetical protein